MALSERASTSCSSSWSEKTCSVTTTPHSSHSTQYRGTSLDFNACFCLTNKTMLHLIQAAQKTLKMKGKSKSHTSLMMLRLAGSRGAGLLPCPKRRVRAFSLSSHWAAALLWDLWISCLWLWSRREQMHKDLDKDQHLYSYWNMFYSEHYKRKQTQYHNNAVFLNMVPDLTSSAGISLCTDRSLTVLCNRQRTDHIHTMSR